MNKNNFDSELQKYIKNLIEITWEYVYKSDKIDNLYIYTLLGRNEYFNIIVNTRQNYYRKHKIDKIDDEFLVTDYRQECLNDKSIDEIKKIETLFASNKRDVPFEVKIIYSPQTKKLDVKFNYENPLKYENSAVADGFRAWIKELNIELI